MHWFRSRNFARFGEFNYTRDNHIRPQVEFVSKRLEVFAFEDGLEAPLAKACEYLGLEAPPLRHEKRGTKVKLEATAQTLANIADFYQDDFSEFGYSVDDFGNSFGLSE